MLLQVDRPVDALRELTTVLAEDPEHVEAHIMMASALVAQERYAEATAAAEKAVALAPDRAITHYMLGAVLCDRDREKEALRFAREAVRINPDDADHHALVAACHAGLAGWKPMLAAADAALELDPIHSRALTLRAHALRMLGRADAAADVLRVALAEEPDDPDVHTAFGYTCLERRAYRDAVGHFREALRLEPDHVSARTGLIEALKASNPLYRPLLWWMLWSARLTSGRSLLLVFGLMYGVRALARSMRGVPGLEIAATALVVLYIFAVWTSWVGASLFDLLIYLRRETRALLPPRERLVAVAVGATVCAAPVAATLLAALGQPVAAIMAALAFLAVAIPVSGGLSLPNARARVLGTVIALTAVIVASAGTLFAAIDGWRGAVTDPDPTRSLGKGLLAFALLGAPLSTWLLLGLGMFKQRR